MASLKPFKAFLKKLLETKERNATMLPLREAYASSVKPVVVF